MGYWLCLFFDGKSSMYFDVCAHIDLSQSAKDLQGEAIDSKNGLI